MRFAEMGERLAAMAEKNWRPRTEDLTKDSPKPEEGVSQEDAVNDVTPSDELSDEEQQLQDGAAGEQLLETGNSTAATEAPSWAQNAAAAAASWQAEHPETTSTA
jgi:hypothetical protein